MDKLLAGRLPEAVGRGLRRLRCLRTGDDGRPDRWGTRPEGVGSAGPVSDAGQDILDRKRRSPGSGWPPSMTITGSCWPGCWPGSTLSTPTSPPLTPRSGTSWPLPLMRSPGSMRSQGSGLDMIRFTTPALFASWTKFAPGINSSAGKTKGNSSTGHGDMRSSQLPVGGEPRTPPQPRSTICRTYSSPISSKPAAASADQRHPAAGRTPHPSPSRRATAGPRPRPSA